MGRRAAALVAVACGLTALVVPVAAEAAGPEAPTATITPNTNLVDEQVVTVHGTGFPPNRIFHAEQCLAPASDGACRENFGFDFDAAVTGSFTVRARLEAQFRLYDGTPVDCRTAPGTCVLLVHVFAGIEGGGGDTAVEIPLDFDPAAPLAPDPTLDVTPTTGLTDAQLVDVSGGGFGAPGSDDGHAVGHVDFLQCTTPIYTYDTCWASEAIPIPRDVADASGAVATRARLWTMIPLTSGRADCRVTPCYLVAAEAPSGDEVSVPISFDPAAPLWDRSITLSVEPDRGLHDGDAITVSVAHYLPDEQSAVRQCAEIRWYRACTAPVAAPASPEGTATVSFVVRQRFRGEFGREVDCAVDRCFIATGREWSSYENYDSRAPISFVAAGVAADPVPVTPAFTG